MKYISECCKAEAIIRNNDTNLCSKCGEECDGLERIELKQTEEQKNFSSIMSGLFDADDALKLQPVSDIFRGTIKLESLITIY